MERRERIGGVNRIITSSDGSTIVLQNVYSELFPAIETGRYEYQQESIVCLSTQIGCPNACIFCKSTGPFNFPGEKNPKRFLRNLRAAEIVVESIRALEKMPVPKDSQGIVFSYMGIGEPFANIEAVKISIGTLSQIYPGSRFTISTVGSCLQKIKDLADEISEGKYKNPIKLHISLHSPDDRTRKKIIPVAKPIDKTLAAAEYFAKKTNTKVKLNYVLLKGLNDREGDVNKLVRLLKGKRHFILKISDLNSDNASLKVSVQDADRFCKQLADFGISTERFQSLGCDIGAGCGQFALNEIRVK